MIISNLIKALKVKMHDSVKKMLIYGLIAGFFISIGATLFGITTSFGAEFRLLGAILFSVGLILVVFLKAQLFTGNNLLILTMFTGEGKFRDLFRNWFFVYLGNFLGAIIAVLLGYFSFVYFDDLAQNMIIISKQKIHYNFFTAFGKAILCNILVCTGITFGISFSNIFARLIGIIIPITLFVFMGFEHSIANMFFVPLGLFLDGVPFEQGVHLFFKNIIPVTIGNILGGFIISLILMLKIKMK